MCYVVGLTVRANSMLTELLLVRKSWTFQSNFRHCWIYSSSAKVCELREQEKENKKALWIFVCPLWHHKKHLQRKVLNWNHLLLYFFLSYCHPNVNRNAYYVWLWQELDLPFKLVKLKYDFFYYHLCCFEPFIWTIFPIHSHWTITLLVTASS